MLLRSSGRRPAGNGQPSRLGVGQGPLSRGAGTALPRATVSPRADIEATKAGDTTKRVCCLPSPLSDRPLAAHGGYASCTDAQWALSPRPNHRHPVMPERDHPKSPGRCHLILPDAGNSTSQSSPALVERRRRWQPSLRSWGHGERTARDFSSCPSLAGAQAPSRTACTRPMTAPRRATRNWESGSKPLRAATGAPTNRRVVPRQMPTGMTASVTSMTLRLRFVRCCSLLLWHLSLDNAPCSSSV